AGRTLLLGQGLAVDRQGSAVVGALGVAAGNALALNFTPRRILVDCRAIVEAHGVARAAVCEVDVEGVDLGSAVGLLPHMAVARAVELEAALAAVGHEGASHPAAVGRARALPRRRSRRPERRP